MRRTIIAMLTAVMLLYGCTRNKSDSPSDAKPDADAPLLETITLEVDGIA